MSDNGPKDQIDTAIEAADAAAEPTAGQVMVAQATLTRNGGMLRVIVPRDFEDGDVVAIIELTMHLLKTANEIRKQRPDGLILPDRPALTSVDGQKLS